MLTAGSYPPISIDFGNDKLGMVLQYRDVKNGQIVWRDYTVDGETVKSPVDIDTLPFGKHRLDLRTLQQLTQSPKFVCVPQNCLRKT